MRSATHARADRHALADAKSLPGAVAPFGFFDPAGLTAAASVEEVRRWRESELVHGRVCMLAAVGYLVGENIEGHNWFLNVNGDISGARRGMIGLKHVV